MIRPAGPPRHPAAFEPDSGEAAERASEHGGRTHAVLAWITPALAACSYNLLAAASAPHYCLLRSQLVGSSLSLALSLPPCRPARAA